MANPASFPLRGSPLREVFFIGTTLQIVGPQGGVSSSVSVTPSAGFTAQVLSGSSPGQFTSQFPYTWNASGSYTLNLYDLWPTLVCTQLTIGTSVTGSGGLTGDTKWLAQVDLAIPTLNTGSSTGVGATGGVNQIGIALTKSGSLADPAAGETVDVNVLLMLQNYLGGNFGQG